MICQILIVVIAIIAYFVVDLLIASGEFRNLPYHGDDSCRKVLCADGGAVGLEDCTVIADNVICSSDFRLDWMHFDHASEPVAARLAKARNGGFYLYSGEDSSLTKVDMQGPNRIMKSFHPHGVSFVTGTVTEMYEGKQETFPEELLFVVNHQPEGDRVEIFEVYNNGTVLSSLESVHHSLLKNVNDVVAISRKEFYATTWHYYEQGSWMNMAEMYGRMRWTYVSHCVLIEEKRSSYWNCTAAATGLASPNGIALHKGLLYVVECLGRQIHVYEPSAKGLVEKDVIFTNSLCDNIEVSRGRLLAACHPKALTFAKYSKDPKNEKSPTQVLEVLQSKDGRHKLREILATEKYSAGTVALELGDEMLIGSVYEPGLFVCPRTGLKKKN